jgi:polyhydroxybutyrate depolymerase
MRTAKVLLCTILLVALSGCTPSVAQTTTLDAVGQRVNLTVDKLDRSFLVRTPERERGELLPVIIAMHGVGSNAQEFEDWTGITDSVDGDRFVAIYPDGAPVRDGRQVWNAGACCTTEGSPRANDPAFLNRILDSVEKYGGDPDRVYVVGFSNGGMMTYRLACDAGDRLAGIAVIAGAFNVESCASTTALPAIIIHGTADDTVPYAGGISAKSEADGIRGVSNAAVGDAIAYWAARNSCAVPGGFSEAGPVVHERIHDCRGRGSVDVYTIDGGDHTWTTDNGDLNMTDIVLDAFVR